MVQRLTGQGDVIAEAETDTCQHRDYLHIILHTKSSDTEQNPLLAQKLHRIRPPKHNLQLIPNPPLI
jgi:hypothetical protein